MLEKAEEDERLSLKALDILKRTAGGLGVKALVSQLRSADALPGSMKRYSHSKLRARLCEDARFRVIGTGPEEVFHVAQESLGGNIQSGVEALKSRAAQILENNKNQMLLGMLGTALHKANVVPQAVRSIKRVLEDDARFEVVLRNRGDEVVYLLSTGSAPSSQPKVPGEH